MVQQLLLEPWGTSEGNGGCAAAVGCGCRFHAASALRDAVVREWGMLGAEGRTALRSYLMSYLMAHAEEPAMQARGGDEHGHGGGGARNGEALSYTCHPCSGAAGSPAVAGLAGSKCAATSHPSWQQPAAYGRQGGLIQPHFTHLHTRVDAAFTGSTCAGGPRHAGVCPGTAPKARVAGGGRDAREPGCVLHGAVGAGGRALGPCDWGPGGDASLGL